VVVLGAGASGIASAKLLMYHGVGDVIGVDRAGVLHPDRTDNMNPYKRTFADQTNRRRLKGGLREALKGADVLIGLSGPGLVDPGWLTEMERRAIVFALANPVPEIMPEEMPENVRVVATGRSDYPNQINNVLVFPGVFRGLLDSRARAIDDAMKVAAARALAGLVGDDERSEEYIIPSVFDRRVAPTVADAVKATAVARGLGETEPGR
jgi:malate dehydrogenase (oxaloacetate-decarboxylating)